MSKKTPIGAGLNALLGGATRPTDRHTPGPKKSPGTDSEVLAHLSIKLIKPGRYQPRTHLDPDKIDELAASIKAQGLVQPVVVRRVENGWYELIAGERRWRAAKKAGLAKVPAVIREVSDSAALALGLIENIQREDLNPLEESSALARLIEEFELTHAQAAEAVGRSRTAVSNLLRLQELEQGTKALVAEGALEMGHARALLALRGAEQLKAAQEVARRHLSVRATEALVRRLARGQSARQEPVADPETQRTAEDLAERIRAHVEIQRGSKPKGRIVIHFDGQEEYADILQRLRALPRD